MKQLFTILKEQKDAGNNCVLAVVMEAKGSVPGKAGAYMVTDKSGLAGGTIGGGAIEYEAVQTGQKICSERIAVYCRDFDLSKDAAAGLGMVCGGSVKVLFNFLDMQNKEIRDFIRQGYEAQQSRREYWLELPIKEGAPKIRSEMQKVRQKQRGEEDDCAFFYRKMGSSGKVYIFGGGHLAEELTPLLSHLDFRCIVSDDREEFASAALFPEAEEVRLVSFDRLEEQFIITPEDYIAVMTRGHMCDLDVERFALKTPAGYIGVVGSAKKTAFVREKLMKEGFSEQDLDRIITPVGLDIGSETPAEIAVSIAAQLIQVRHGKRKNFTGINSSKQEEK